MRAPGRAGLRQGPEPEAHKRDQRGHAAGKHQSRAKAACKLTSPVPAPGAIAKELALALEVCAAETILEEH